MEQVAQDVEARVRAFIVEQLDPDAGGLGADADLLAAGLLNSLTLMHLVMYLEEAFAIEVTPAEFDARNFRTLRAIEAFVQRKTASV
jgi:acyl carrier protein